MKQNKSHSTRPGAEVQQREEGRQGNGLKPEEGLDDLDLDLLGEGRDEDHGEEDVEDSLDDTEGEGDGSSE